MEIQYIKEFVVLAGISNYGRAADILYTSQSTLFNHIKALEAELRVPLFIRDGKKIVLSDYGRIFIPYANTIINAAEQYIEEIDENRNVVQKIIRIGTQYRISGLLKEFRKKHEEYDITMLDSHNCINALDDGSCELAFIRNVADPDKKYNILHYFKDSIVAAFYPSHPMAKEKSVSLKKLKKEKYVMISQYQEKECYGVTICKEAGFIPKVVMTAANGNEAARLVSEGVGISLFLKHTIMSEEFKDLVLIDLEPEIECNISLCWLKRTVLSEGAKAFLECVEGYMSQIN